MPKVDATTNFSTLFQFLGETSGLLVPALDSPILIFFFLVFATYISEDLTCIGAGVLAGLQLISPTTAISACVVGIFTGDLLLYGLGVLFRKGLLRFEFLKKRISKSKLDRARQWIEKKGVRVFFTCRFVPGSRLPTYVYAGIIRSNFFQFSWILLASSLVWVPVIVLLTMFFGQVILIDRLNDFKSFVPYLLIFIIIFTMAYKGFFLLLQKKNRQLFKAWIHRKTHFEFWNTHIFYLPVYFYLFLLGLRYSSLTLPTLSNPFIPGGGIRGELKSEILEKLRGNKYLARFILLELSKNYPQRIKEVRQFMQENGPDFPLALKPNVGERGDGFRRVHSQNQLEQELLQMKEDTLVQENIDGEEFGISYLRKPGEKKGKVFSLSKKAMLWLRGDGKSTLETLILNHPRAVLKTKFHFKKHKDHLNDIIPDGEFYELVDLGSHSMGSIFLDYRKHITPELDKTINEISLQIPEFYVGRFDVRVPDLESLKRGENIKVLELNLVTGEPAHIYHPGSSVFRAYKDLFWLWKQIIEIGDKNRKRGFKPPSLKEALQSIKS